MLPYEIWLKCLGPYRCGKHSYEDPKGNQVIDISGSLFLFRLHQFRYETQLLSLDDAYIHETLLIGKDHESTHY